MKLGLGIRNRVVNWLRELGWRWRQAPRRSRERHRVGRLHVGAGRTPLQGWTNVDIVALPGIDFVLDVRDGLPFEAVEYIYAEHFIEHLTHDEAIRFLAESRNSLAPDGVLRLSTPNLDWVLATLYRSTSPDPIRDCFAINKGFRAWGHQFLYNEATLVAALLDAGFLSVRSFAYGESDHDALTALERHERSSDDPQLPHVVIVEATGSGDRHGRLDALSKDYDQALDP